MSLTIPGATSTEENEVIKPIYVQSRHEERVQCNWNFESCEDGIFHAVNTITGRVFDGTKEEFREILKGN